MVAARGEGEGLEGESSQRGDGDGEATAGGGDRPGRDAGAATWGRRDGDGGRSRRWRACARAARVPLSSWREEGDDWHGQLAGPADGAAGPGQAAQ